MAKVTSLIALQLKTQITDRFIVGTSVLAGATSKLSTDIYANDPNNYFWDDVTVGVLSITTKRGVDAYTGAQPIPTVSPGVMHVRTTNQLLDPKYYPYLKPRQEMRLVYLGDPSHPVIYQGKVDNIIVDYVADREKPLIQFDVVDPVGLLQQAKVKLTSLAYSANRTWNHRINEILTNANKLDILNKDKITVDIVKGGLTKHGYWDGDMTVLEALQLANNTECGFVYFDKNNILHAIGGPANYNEFVSGSQGLMNSTVSGQSFTNLQSGVDEYAEGTSGMLGYKNILIDYNSSAVVNQVVFQNQWGYTTTTVEADPTGEYFYANNTTEFVENEATAPYNNDASINTYGTHALTVNTNFDLSVPTPNIQRMNETALMILAKNVSPGAIAREIEWDGKQNLDWAVNSEILDKVYILHRNKKIKKEQNNNQFVELDADYSIIGIQHEFQADEDTWRVKYILFEPTRFL